MMMRTTRALSALVFRGVVYLGLFVLVVVGHTALSAGLRSLGVEAGLALLVAGAIVLASVLFGLGALGRRR